MTYALPQLAAVTAFLAPPPISPLFQNGGKFQGWNEDISLVAFFIVMLGLLDKILVTPLIRDKVNAPAPPASARKRHRADTLAGQIRQDALLCTPCRRECYQCVCCAP